MFNCFTLPDKSERCMWCIEDNKTCDYDDDYCDPPLLVHHGVVHQSHHLNQWHADQSHW